MPSGGSSNQVELVSQVNGKHRTGRELLVAAPTPSLPVTRDASLIAAAVAAATPFFIVDPIGKLLYANPSYMQLNPDRRVMLYPLDEIVDEVVAHGGRPVREIALTFPVPSRWRVEHFAVMEGGTLVGIAGSFHEISDLFTARHTLSLTQERLDDVTRLVSDWIWETDTAVRLTFVSPRVAEVLGFQPVELLGRSMLDLGNFAVASPDGGGPLDPRRRAPFRDLAFTIAHRDGSQRLFHVSGLPIFDPLSGVFLGFRGTALDVSEQEATASRAARSQNQLTQALESISEGFALFDAADHLVLSNNKFRGSFPSISDDIVPGMSFEDFLRAGLVAGDINIPPDRQQEWLENRMKLRAEPRASFEIKLSNDRWIKVSDHRTADGSTVGIRTDITDLKHREEALFAAKESAEIASRSKSEFLANISHELRTPLNAIIGFSEIMREEIFGALGSPQYREYIGDVLDSAHHLLEVINDILDIAKAEAGKLELIEDDVEIAQVALSAMRLVQERAQRGGVTIRSSLTMDMPLLYADERKLKQVLLNLLTNAVKFTPSGGTIDIAGELREDGGFVIMVRDTGIGIAAENIPTALAPFGQVDAKLNRKYEGTGLGLPLSNAMINLHQGRLTIESAVGKGTTVSLHLPPERVRAALPQVRTTV
jgi:PAS domain S-box-containing protein